MPNQTAEPSRESLLRPTRARVLQLLAEPGSAASVARRLGVPRQKVNYHLKELERQGMVELVEERKKGNCTERLVRATARAYLVSAEALGALAADPASVPDRFSSEYLVAVAARSVREVAVMREQAERAGKRLPTLTLQSEVRFSSARERNQFAEELANAVARLVARYHDEAAPDGRRFRLFLGMHPAPAPHEPPPNPGEEP